MLELLRDGVWQFVGALISLLALVVAIVTIVVQARKKSFSYTIIADNELLHRNDLLSEHVKVKYDDVNVVRLRLLAIRFRNDGNVPISSRDFEEPLTIGLERGSKILSVTCSEQRPEALRIDASADGNVATLKPVLLNRGDQFALQLIVGDSVKIPKVGGRILGVPELKNRPLNSSSTVLKETLSRGLASAAVALLAALANIAWSLLH
jgi:hypothetical protein